MTTLPEEAVKAAKDVLYYANPNDVERALTAALPFLPVQGAVKTGERLPEAEKEITRYQQERDRWINYTVDLQRIIEALCDRRGLPEPISTARHHYDMAREYLSSRAGNAARILPALEPSAARELALEEGYRQGIEAAAQIAERPVIGFSDGAVEASRRIASSIRSLSSPDHADAGKVYGNVLSQDVINLVIAAREFWDVANDCSDESIALDCALEAFASRVPYENEPED